MSACVCLHTDRWYSRKYHIKPFSVGIGMVAASHIYVNKYLTIKLIDETDKAIKLLTSFLLDFTNITAYVKE